VLTTEFAPVDSLRDPLPDHLIAAAVGMERLAV